MNSSQTLTSSLNVSWNCSGEQPIESINSEPQLHPPTFASTGVPVTQNEQFDPTRHQSVVKCGGKMLVCSSYAMVFCGVLGGICNLIAGVAAPAYANISFVDGDGQQINMRLGVSGLFMIGLFKAVFCYMCYRQGRMTLDLFKPILKDYADAESGRSQGIAMVTRLSKDMYQLIRSLWKILAGWHFLIWTFCMYTAYWANEQADTYLLIKYDFYQNHNNDNATIVPVPVTDVTYVDDMPVPEEDNYILTDDVEITFDEPEFAKTKGTWWRDMLNGESETFQPNDQTKQWFKDYFPETQALIATHVENEEVDPVRSLQNAWFKRLPKMDIEQAKMEVHTMVSFIIFAIFAQCAFWLTLFQACFIHFVKRVSNSQKVLEHKYMGPEIRRDSQVRPVIHYVPEPADSEASVTGRVVTGSINMV